MEFLRNLGIEDFIAYDQYTQFYKTERIIRTPLMLSIAEILFMKDVQISGIAELLNTNDRTLTNHDINNYLEVRWRKNFDKYGDESYSAEYLLRFLKTHYLSDDYDYEIDAD